MPSVIPSGSHALGRGDGTDSKTIPAELLEVVDDFAGFGVRAFTTTRAVGSFSSSSDEPVRAVMGRWDALRATVARAGVARLASMRQVHGTDLIVHVPGWTGWLRGGDADGHVSAIPATALVVSAADCVPVFIAHPSGTIALLHSGWRGTAARIIDSAIAALARLDCPAAELHVHLGPAICGKCYEVSADVAERLLGSPATGPQRIDLRSVIAQHARERGVRFIAASPLCTKCDNGRFYSHRAADAGRQLSVMFAESR
jgi:polyphenol oxidase